MTENRTENPTAGPSRVKGKGWSAREPLKVDPENLAALESAIIAGDLGDPLVGHV
jgi:hypothetical protein